MNCPKAGTSKLERKIMKHKFQIFGSENSTDYDVLVFVDSMPENIDIGHQWCKDFNDQLAPILPDKPINSNFGIVLNNQIASVFKGTNDEVNNALINTYDLHQQYHHNFVTQYMDRDVELKLYRVYRSILSFFSRSELRSIIKPALKSGISARYQALRLIDFTEIREFPHKKESIEDIYKVMSFQFGQLFSLIDGFEEESYTKNGIIKNYPELEPMLNRKALTDYDMKMLNLYKERLLHITQQYL